MCRSILQLAVWLLLAAVFFATRSFGQFAQRGGVEGFVLDASGAAVVNAEVTLADLGQNQTRQASTDGTGAFCVHDLTAGQYQLSVKQQGFQPATSEPIALNIGRTSRYDFKLRPGSATQSVTVTSNTVALDTGQANLSTNVSERQIEQLPLNGRNFTSIAALVPGVATTPQLNINPGGTFSVGAQFASGGPFLRPAA
jgi:hypothetical protein